VGRLLRVTPLCAGVLSLGLCLLIAGCGGGGKTRFQFVNAVPDVTNLDLLIDSTAVASNVAYGTTTGYQNTQSGSHNIQIEPSGTSNSLLQQSVTFASGSDTTVIASNFSSNISALVLNDNNSTPPSGDFNLRLVNGSPGLGATDVYIVAPGTDINTVASPTVSNLAFNSSTSYQSVTAGSFDIILTPAGQKIVAIDTGSLTFSAGQVRTFVGLNNPSGGFSYAVLSDLN
jgi:Domain of unknown function (DUF4397)